MGSGQLAAGSITHDKLAAGAASQNLLASGSSPVASGGVVLSPSSTAPDLLQSGYIQVGKIDLIPQKWLQWGNAPEPVAPVDATAKAVWTGTVYLVWGGGNNAGARYNPTTNTWSAMSAVNAPAARTGHCAVWTGSEMIVWGGAGLVTGGRYNPITDTWITMTTTNAPAAREDAPAVWSGTEMIVWGGGNRVETNTGGRYNPATNTWQTMTTTGAPEDRYGHVAVWTGTRLLVCGGGKLVSGQYEVALGTPRSYNPATNTWTVIADGPFGFSCAAVWTGSAMIVTGGYIHDYSSAPTLYAAGAASRYSPATNSWTAIAADVALARYQHSAVWTGTDLLVWGGSIVSYGYAYLTSTGSRYNLATNTWTPLAQTGAPAERANHSAAWTGSRMLIYGGGQPVGGRYDPEANTWSTMAGLTERSARTESTQIWTGRELLIWTGSEMLVWSGYRSGFTGLQDGGLYDPVTATWRPMPIAGAPPVRFNFSLVWTGTRAVLWGGDVLGQRPATGGRFDPATGVWSAISQVNVPPGRTSPTAVWTGHQVIFWGGGTAAAGYPTVHGGYDPVADTWTTVSTYGAPAGRAGHSAVWNGSRMIVWGGETSGAYLGDGGLWSPETNLWTDISSVLPGAPPGRSGHAGVWTGTDLLVWGGRSTAGLLKDANTYTPPGTFYLYQRP